MQFLKPKKYDPGAAQRLAEEAAAREATARETRAAEKARRRALKEELAAARELVQVRGRDIQFVLVGGGPSLEGLRAMAAARRVRARLPARRRQRRRRQRRRRRRRRQRRP